MRIALRMHSAAAMCAPTRSVSDAAQHSTVSCNQPALLHSKTAHRPQSRIRVPPLGALATACLLIPAFTPCLPLCPSHLQAVNPAGGSPTRPALKARNAATADALTTSVSASCQLPTKVTAGTACTRSAAGMHPTAGLLSTCRQHRPHQVNG